jgi:hypothetical protein
MAKLGRKRKYVACQDAAAHRKRQAKYVAKDPGAQRARVKKSEKRHPDKVKARKRKASKGKSTGGPAGRPRKC